MADGARYSRALILGASVVSIAALVTESGLAQTASPPLSPDVADMIGMMRFRNFRCVLLV